MVALVGCFGFLVYLFLVPGEAGGMLGLEQGTPLLQNFAPQGFHAARDTWHIVQGQDGLMYFANSSGVLIFNGHRWERVTLDGNSAARALAVGPNGRVYVGGINQYGYLNRQPSGSHVYVSLSNLDEKRNVGNIWNIHPRSWGVYFMAQGSIFLLRGDNVEEIHFSSIQSVEMGEAIVMVGSNGGIWLMDRTDLRQLPGTETLNPDRLRLLPRDEKRLVCITSDLELLSFDLTDFRNQQGSHLSKPSFKRAQLPPDTYDFLRRNQLRTTRVISESRLALGTRYGGLLVTDLDGAILFRLDRSAGLLRNQINHVTLDAQGNMWLAFNNAFALVELATPIRRYQPRSEGFENIRHTFVSCQIRKFDKFI